MTIMTTHNDLREGPRSSEEEAAMLCSQLWAVSVQLLGLIMESSQISVEGISRNDI